MESRNHILDLVLEICSLLLVIGCGILLWKEYAQVPAEVAVHYNFMGEPDKYGGKFSLIVLLVINSLTYLLLTVLNRYPHCFNFPVKVTEYNRDVLYFYAKRLVRILKFLMVFFLSYLIIHPIYFPDTSIAFIMGSCLSLILFMPVYYIVKLNKFR